MFLCLTIINQMVKMIKSEGKEYVLKFLPSPITLSFMPLLLSSFPTIKKVSSLSCTHTSRKSISMMISSRGFIYGETDYVLEGKPLPTYFLSKKLSPIGF